MSSLGNVPLCCWYLQGAEDERPGEDEARQGLILYLHEVAV